jgi:hypothetical protein
MERHRRAENTPTEIVDKLNKKINAALADPKIKTRLADLGGVPMPMSAADFGKLIAESVDKWGGHQAAVTGLAPKQPFVAALSDDPKGTGRLEPLAGFMTNPAGAAIVNTVGPIRQVTQSTGATPKRYLVIVAGTPAQLGEPLQVQAQ